MKSRSLFVVLGMTGVVALAGARGVSAQPDDVTMQESVAVAQSGHLADAPRAVVPQVLGDAAADLVFTPVTPCRIVDTRNAGGPIATDSTRAFFVSGTTGFDTQGGKVGGCGIPASATSVEMNFVSVTPSGSGDLRAYPYNATPVVPLAAVLNYGNPAGLFAIANGIAQPVCNIATTTCTFHLIIQADAAATQVVVDVVGYYNKADKTQVKTAFTSGTLTGGTFTTVCSNAGGNFLTVVAPVAGKIVARAEGSFIMNHVTGTPSILLVELGTTATDCSVFNFIRIEASWPTAPLTVIPLAVSRVINVAAGSTTTVFLNGLITLGTGHQLFGGGSMEATFIPN